MPAAQYDVTRQVPATHADEVEHRRLLAEGVNQALRARVHPTNDISLAESATTTVVTDLRVHPRSVILIMPLDSVTAGELTSTYVTPGDQTYTVNHPATAGPRTLRVIILG